MAPYAEGKDQFHRLALQLAHAVQLGTHLPKLTTEGLCERTEHLDIFLLFFRPSLNGVPFPMFCLPAEGECQILVFKNIIS